MNNDNQFSRYELIHNGIYESYKTERYIVKKLKCNVADINEYPSFCNFDIFKDNFKECSRIYNSISRRKSRILKKFVEWFYYVSKNNNRELIFGTLTFTDDSLKKTSKETRKRYVSRFLKDNTEYYVANIDFGKQKNREHYHFIALISSRIDKKAWPYGMSSYKAIKTNTSLRNRKNYLLKLTNHTYKDTTQQERVISSRNQYNSIVDFIAHNKNDFDNFRDNFYLSLLEKQ